MVMLLLLVVSWYTFYGAQLLQPTAATVVMATACELLHIRQPGYTLSQCVLPIIVLQSWCTCMRCHLVLQ